MTQSYKIASTPSGLITGGTDVSPRALDAYFYSFTKAQQDARQVNSDPSTDAYFDAMNASLTTLGWNVVRTKLVGKSVSGTPQIPLVTCALAILDLVEEGIGHLVTINRADFETTATHLCTALQNPPQDLATQLDDWWGGAAVTATLRVLDIGPLFELFGIVHLAAAHFAIDISVTSWRNFVLPCSNFSFSARPVLMSLNWQTYRQQEAALKAELSADLSSQIKQTNLVLGTGGTS